MSKSKKNSQKRKTQNVQPKVELEKVEEQPQATVVNEVKASEVKAQKTSENEKNKVVEVKAKDVKKKENKPKKPSKVAKALKDTGNELKKVTWPSFGQVCKQTGVVLVFVIVFAVVLFGFDKLCSFLTGFLF